MAPKSKLILIMAALWLRKKKICALAEDTGRRFWVRKILQERKKYGLYHILTDMNCVYVIKSISFVLYE